MCVFVFGFGFHALTPTRPRVMTSPSTDILLVTHAPTFPHVCLTHPPTSCAQIVVGFLMGGAIRLLSSSSLREQATFNPE